MESASSNEDGKRIAPSWQADPFGRHEERWWDGARWTEKVRSTGTVGLDPPGVDARPEHARDHVPAAPITDATGPVAYQSRHLPRVLVLAVMVLVAIVILLIIGVATA